MVAHVCNPGTRQVETGRSQELLGQLTPGSMKRTVSKKHKKGIQHQPLAASRASPPLHTHTHNFKLIINVEKLKFEAYFKSLQDQINMRINIKPFYFLIKDID